MARFFTSTVDTKNHYNSHRSSQSAEPDDQRSLENSNNMQTNLAVLDRENVPSDLHHRESEINELTEALVNYHPKRSARLVSIFGPSGSGKTTLAKYFTRRFNEQSRPLKTGYTNCIDDKTPTQILQTLLRETGIRPATQPRSTARCLGELENVTDPILITIDEIGYLREPEFIKSLSRIGGIGVILIAMEEHEVLLRMPHEVRSRVQSAPTIRLSRYTQSQIEDILWGRIELALPEGFVTRPAVREMARHADGDAYVAIALLRECANSIDLYYHDKIDRELVDDVKDSVPLARNERDIEHLGTHPHLLYDIIKHDEPIKAGDLRRKYEAEASDPRGDRMRRVYLGELMRYNMITKDGRGLGTRYRTKAE